MRVNWALHQAAVIAAVLLMTSAAAVWAVAHDAGNAPASLAGLYRVEPAARGNPTTTMTFVRFRPDGAGSIELLDLRDDGVSLRAEVRPSSPRTRAWSVAGGKICVSGNTVQCFGFRRDDVTGDLTLDDGARLTRIRPEGYDYR